MAKLFYLPYVIIMSFAELIAIAGVVVYLYKIKCDRENQSGCAGAVPLFRKFFSGRPFSRTYRCAILSHYPGQFIVLATRVGCFSFFFGVAFIWDIVQYDVSSAKYFTHWNIFLIVLYYGMACMASIYGLLYDRQHNSRSSVQVERKDERVVNLEEDDELWSIHMEYFGYSMQIIFEVAGGTALFVTVVVFTILNPSAEFWNFTDHLFTTISFLVELSLNDLVVRWEHVIFNVLWAMLYLIYIWPAVAEGSVHYWPYGFLQVQGASSFGAYTALVVANIGFYALWCALSWLKFRCIAAAGVNDGETSPENAVEEDCLGSESSFVQLPAAKTSTDSPS